MRKRLNVISAQEDAGASLLQGGKTKGDLGTSALRSLQGPDIYTKEFHTANFSGNLYTRKVRRIMMKSIEIWCGNSGPVGSERRILGMCLKLAALVDWKGLTGEKWA